MCGSAIETAEKHADKPGMERLIRLQDMVYKLEKAVMDSGKEAIPEVKGFAQMLHSAVMDQAKKVGIEDEVADYQKMHLDSIVKGDPKPGFGRVDEAMGEALKNWLQENKMYGVMTEAEFDEAAGKKDACYYKVKSRYKVWPSAYASGALVQCRKKGAKNWGNKSKKK